MTTVTGPTPAGTAAAAAAAKSAATTKTGTDAMGSDTFLKLLVAQLKYQDPSKPADGTQFLAQTAQFQMVEKLTELADQNTALLAQQQTSSAIGLVGTTVTYGTGDAALSGKVSSVRLTAAGPVLKVGSKDVPLADVTEVNTTG